MKNYIGRAEDFVPVTTKELVHDYRLDYTGTDFTNMNEGYAVIKFKNTEPAKVKFAVGKGGEPAPNTKSGMLGNDSRVIFEYKMGERELIDGDILEIYDANGKLMRSYEYGINETNSQIGWVMLK